MLNMLYAKPPQGKIKEIKMPDEIDELEIFHPEPEYDNEEDYDDTESDLYGDRD